MPNSDSTPERQPQADRSLPLLLAALPAYLSSFLVLWLADVGRPLWLVQAGVGGLAMLFALLLPWLLRRGGPSARRKEIVALGFILFAVVACLLPLYGSMAPARWVKLGGVQLYLSAVGLPAALLAFEALRASSSRFAEVGLTGLAICAGCLVLQPDASQVLALSVAVGTLLLGRDSAPVRMSRKAAGPLFFAICSAVVFLAPDPLAPVPHVEGVLKLGFAHGWVAGSFILLGTLALPGGFLRLARSSGDRCWLALALHYLVLHVGAFLGLTPAPLVGYGAAPVLGFGLLVAAHRSLHSTGSSAPENAAPAGG